jgi:hypothetical protein
VGRHASSHLVITQREDRVGGTAAFERAGLLKVLAFKKHFRIANPIQRPACQDRRVVHVLSNPIPRFPDFDYRWLGHRYPTRYVPAKVKSSHAFSISDRLCLLVLPE